MSLAERTYTNRNRVHTRKYHHRRAKHVAKKPSAIDEDYNFVCVAFVFVTVMSLLFIPMMLFGSTTEQIPMPNPTYAEMQAFVSSDKTDMRTYIPNVYICHHYSTDVVSNANKRGMRAGYVLLDMDDGSNTWLGHAIVVFQTSDRGFYFLEPQLDIIFSMAQMDAMIANGRYSIEGGSGYRFDNQLIGYRIEWRGYVIEPSG
jgi:hypothetical protein